MNKKIKILEIGMTDSLGGIETFLINLHRNINPEEFVMDYIGEENKTICFENEINNKNSKIYKIPNYVEHPIKYIKMFKQIVKSEKYDIVHINKNSLSIPLQLIAASLSKVPKIIIHSHSTQSNKGGLFNLLHKLNKHLYLPLATHYFSCSHEAAKWFYTNKYIESKTHYYINNAINIKKFVRNDELRKKMKDELNLATDEFVIGHVGRFVEAKNHDFIIDIFFEVQKKIPDSKLILVGTGPLQNVIKQKVKDLKIESKVIFLNARDDVEKIYQVMDVFLMPSKYEGMPIVGIEAQTAGLACYFSNTIDSRVKILQTSKILNLNEGANFWADEIIANKNLKSVDISKIINSEFNIETEVKKIERILKS